LIHNLSEDLKNAGVTPEQYAKVTMRHRMDLKMPPYYAFDLLNLDGSDLRSRPLIERRDLLEKLLKKAPANIKFSEDLEGSREELLRVARQFQFEGITAKRPNSLYEAG
jgi:bifunctional non-homologous end joining protein LigD